METEMRLIEYFILGLIAYPAICLIIGYIKVIIITSNFDWYEKIIWNIRLPKKKKYKNKPHTLYKIEESEYQATYEISKYEQKWKKTNIDMFFNFFIIPMRFYVWGYDEIVTYETNIKDDDVMKITEPLSVFFEKRHAKVLEKEKEEDIKKNKLKNKLNLLNNDFEKYFC